jgi:hypothetical protein
MPNGSNIIFSVLTTNTPGLVATVPLGWQLYMELYRQVLLQKAPNSPLRICKCVAPTEVELVFPRIKDVAIMPSFGIASMLP